MRSWAGRCRWTARLRSRTGGRRRGTGRMCGRCYRTGCMRSRSGRGRRRAGCGSRRPRGGRGWAGGGLIGPPSGCPTAGCLSALGGAGSCGPRSGSGRAGDWLCPPRRGARRRLGWHGARPIHGLLAVGGAAARRNGGVVGDSFRGDRNTVVGIRRRPPPVPAAELLDVHIVVALGGMRPVRRLCPRRIGRSGDRLWTGMTGRRARGSIRCGRTRHRSATDNRCGRDGRGPRRAERRRCGSRIRCFRSWCRRPRGRRRRRRDRPAVAGPIDAGRGNRRWGILWYGLAAVYRSLELLRRPERLHVPGGRRGVRARDVDAVGGLVLHEMHPPGCSGT
jgi:hypothetical protein